ncbi:YabP/YqfC family sporulation protein [Clostridioides mangenotii]|uniref:YabP/YqfC family sporulation protein n=1 Tax=Metaclostridioides mangenotii TaxID=1540 RepID=UPI001C11F972|nr:MULTISPECIES: YabP/YqfC family sporulation protein [Clostridioides]MBS5788386.1 YabP/YqfC family sporulation protein [Clostridioides difficile]MBU5308560.1 YabP/YqfC family sporulation protein [Clostridioides mangenotii]MCR1953385.1 YabP/YqfC family sporulation protein [Clostridioides mangenotii]
MEQNITLKDRSNLVISGVEHIYSFNDKRVEVKTSVGEMVIEGENLDMSKLSIDEKIISIEGTINSIVYAKPRKPQESFFKKVFK